MQALLCRSFEELKSPLVEAFLTPNRGWGVKAAQPIQDGCFVVEYVGQFLRASILWSSSSRYPA